MKKFLISFSLILSIFLCATLFACAKTFMLTPFVTQLRSDIFEGSSDDVTLRAAFGFNQRKTPRDASSDKIYGLTFKLVDKETTNQEYTVSLTVDGKSKKATFSFSPVSHALTAFIETDPSFNQTQLTVTLSTGGEKRDITLNSILPPNTITYDKALTCLYEQQTELINGYKNQDGGFMASLVVRVIVKDGKAYWYIGISEQMDKTKALLINGASGEVLAIREVL